jgi:tyrosine phenol-lyase
MSVDPFRVRAWEPAPITTRQHRTRVLRECGFNLFALHAADVTVDLLTDSGTGSLSAQQQAALLTGDESYAGSRSFMRLQDTVAEIFGMPHVMPAHQGRAAEHLLARELIPSAGGAPMVVPSNGFFDTTRAHIELRGARAVDLRAEPGATGYDADFLGNINLDRLDDVLAGPDQVPAVLMVITNNVSGGQPVSLANLRAVRQHCTTAGVPVWLDACRFAENAWFIQAREPGQQHRGLTQIALDQAAVADVITMSAKKDGHAHIGGFVACDNADLADALRHASIIFEGYPSYGGLTGRDLDVMAIGLKQILDPDHLGWRIHQIAEFAADLDAAGVPVLLPAGGHAVYLDANSALPHLPRDSWPGQALAVAVYAAGGVRGCEIGSLLAGRDPETGENRWAPTDWVRLAVPRTTYSQDTLRAVADIAGQVVKRSDQIPGLRVVRETPVLRHFTATFETLP